MTESTEQRSPKRNRSRNYPAISLQDAIERARTLHEQEGRNAAPFDVVAEHWGSKPTSSTAMRFVGALNAYGLLDSEGRGKSRQLRLSERALDIVLAEDIEEDERARAAVAAAAIEPALYRELWDKYGSDMPSDATLRTYLRRDCGMNPRTVDDVIASYRATISFAGLDGHDIIDDEPKDERAERDSPPNPSNPPNPPQLSRRTEPGMKQDIYGLDEGDLVLQWPSRLSAESFQEASDWLDLIKRKLRRSVASADEQGQGTAGADGD